MASLEQAPGDSGKEKNTFLTGRNLHKTRLREEQASATTLWRGVVCGTAAYPLLGWERLVPGRCLHPFQLPGGGPPPAYRVWSAAQLPGRQTHLVGIRNHASPT